jgi:HAD superfamily hydrolase (TIGR01509 family)
VALHRLPAMIHTRAIRGILFDLDGVLIHSTTGHSAAFEHIFRAFRIKGFRYSDYAGWRTRDVIADVFKRNRLPISTEQLAELAAEKTRTVREILDRDPPLHPAAGRVLAELAAEFPLALASSGSRSNVQAFLGWSGSASLFRSILSGDEVENAKPHPEAYARSAQQLALDPAECLVVEDAVAGVEAARALGSPVVGIPGTCSEEALRLAGATDVIADLSALPDWIRQHSVAPSHQHPLLTSACWTALVPAAGRGSRLGYHLPKILFPVAGRPCLDWLLDIFAAKCAKLVFVLSPEGAPDVIAALEQRIPGRYQTVLQVNPTGMGDAVRLGLSAVVTPQVAVAWGDQVALQHSSVDLCLRLHQGPLQPGATAPTVLRDAPYIHFERDSEGRVSSVRQAREGDPMPQRGESDTGFFCFRTSSLRKHLEAMRMSDAQLGGKTGEFNLLPVLPRIAQQEGLLTPRVMTLEETVGINSAADAAILEPILLRRRRNDSRN